MAALTITGQVATVMTFSVPSVATLFESPPAQVSTAQFPLLFVRNARIEQEGRVLTYGQSDLPTLRFEICVLVETVRQSNQFDAYTLTRQIMDELNAAIETNAAALRLDAYEVRETFESSGDTSYFAVVAEIRTS